MKLEREGGKDDLKKKYKPIIELFLSIAGNENALIVHKVFIHYTGDFSSAMLLERLLYLSQYTKCEWIIRSDKDFCAELYMTRYALRQARERLEGMGVLKTMVATINDVPRLHYRVNLDVLADDWARLCKLDKLDEPTNILKGLIKNIHIQNEAEMDENNNGHHNEEEEEDIYEWFAKRGEEQQTRVKNKQAKVRGITVEQHRAGAEKALDGFFAKSKANGSNPQVENFLAKVPENERPLARAFCERFGRPPLAREATYWRKEWKNQYEIGLTPKLIDDAFNYMEENSLFIKSPASLTAVAYNIMRGETKVERKYQTYRSDGSKK